jgi:hypothetical protein
MYKEGGSGCLFAGGMILLSCATTKSAGAIFACTSCMSVITFIVGATLVSIEKHKTGCDLFAKENACTAACPQLWMGVKIWFYLVLMVGVLLFLFVVLQVCCVGRKAAPSLTETFDFFERKHQQPPSFKETVFASGGGEGGTVSRMNAQHGMSF